MTIRFYLMPAVIEMRDGRLTKHPKYDDLWSGLNADTMDYGREGSFLVATDVASTIHDAIVANADVAAFPANIDNQIGTALATVTTEAESRHIPLLGISATSTYRHLLRRVVLCCQLGQAVEGARFDLFGAPVRTALFGGGITLDTTFSSLTAQERTVLLRAFDVLNLDRTGLTAASTLRQILIVFNGQWKATRVYMMGEPL